MSFGFTLLELLVVMAIIGILSSLAVPQYNEYRARGFDVRAQLDLRNVAIAEEAYFLDYEHYLECDQESCTELPGISRLSDGVILAISAPEPDERFTGTAAHTNGTGKVYAWDSEAGGLID